MIRAMLEDLVLYGSDHYTSPYVFSAFVTLKEKKVPFRLEVLSLEKKEHERPEYADRTYTGKVPALRHGDFWIAESSAIDEYVEEAFPPPAHPRMYPEDPRERARVRMVQAFLRSDLVPLRQARPTSTFFLGEKPGPMTDAARRRRRGRTGSDVAYRSRFQNRISATSGRTSPFISPTRA